MPAWWIPSIRHSEAEPLPQREVDLISFICQYLRTISTFARRAAGEVRLIHPHLPEAAIGTRHSIACRTGQKDGEWLFTALLPVSEIAMFFPGEE